MTHPFYPCAKVSSVLAMAVWKQLTDKGVLVTAAADEDDNPIIAVFSSYKIPRVVKLKVSVLGKQVICEIAQFSPSHISWGKGPTFIGELFTVASSIVKVLS